MSLIVPVLAAEAPATSERRRRQIDKNVAIHVREFLH